MEVGCFHLVMMGDITHHNELQCLEGMSRQPKISVLIFRSKRFCQTGTVVFAKIQNTQLKAYF